MDARQHKKALTRALSLLLLLAMLLSAIPAHATSVDDAQKLHTLGLFMGVGTLPDGSPDFALNRVPTRIEGITMLVRLLGKDAEARAGNWSTPFTDVPDWGKPYVGYAYANGLTKGTGDTTFGSDVPINATQYITFVLRAMGYQDGRDFYWDRAWEWSDAIAITHGEYNANTTAFLRGDIASISFSALSVWCPSGEKVLIKLLYEQDAVTADAIVAVGLRAVVGLSQVYPPRIGIDSDTIYTEPIRLGIMNYFDNGDDLLYYTLDGSTPTKNSAQFTFPSTDVMLDKDTVIKAIAVSRKDGIPSEVATARFRMGEKADTKFDAGASFYDFKDDYLHTDADKAADKLIGQIIKAGMTEIQKEKAVYDWFIKNVDYDSAVEVMLNNYYNPDREPYTEEEWKQIDEATSAYGALVNKLAVCSGYARAFELLMGKCGITAYYVTGDFAYESGHSGPNIGYKQPGHAWNIVRIDGQYYQLDVTWDASRYRNNVEWQTWTEPDVDYYHWVYERFNVSDEKMRTCGQVTYQYRTWDRSKYPACNSTMRLYEYLDAIPLRNYVGLLENAIQMWIYDDGVLNWRIEYEPNTMNEAGVVLRQTFPKGTTMTRNQTQVFTVSSGKPTAPPSGGTSGGLDSTPYFHEVTLAEQMQMARDGNRYVFIFYGDDSYSASYLPLYKAAADELKLDVYGVKIGEADRWTVNFPVVWDQAPNNGPRLPVIFLWDGTRIFDWGERIAAKAEALKLLRKF